MMELKKRKKNIMIKIDIEMPKNCNGCPFLFFAKNCALVMKQVEPNSKPD